MIIVSIVNVDRVPLGPDTIVYPVGPTGPRGLQGDPGPQGNVGPPGPLPSGPAINADGPAGTFRGHGLLTSGSYRFDIAVTNWPEAGGNVGSDLIINRFGDGGEYLGTALTINRASGVVTIPSLVVDRAVAQPIAGAGFVVDGPAGTFRYHQLSSNGVARWDYGAGGAPETGGNAGSDWFINRFGDGGEYLGTALTIWRSSGDVSIGGVTVRSDGVLMLEDFTVGTLPDAASSKNGVAVVTDAASTTHHSIVAGGGAHTVLVLSDGTDWRIA